MMLLLIGFKHKNYEDSVFIYGGIMYNRQ